MSLVRIDETDLLVPLHGGLHEVPRWTTFLSRLRRRLRADHVALIFGQGETPIYETSQWFSGRDIAAEARMMDGLPATDPIPYHRLRPGRVYSAAEMIDAEVVRHERFRRDYLERLGVHYGRFMRVTASGDSAWLTTARTDADFQAADSALISGLAPHLSIVLQTMATVEQARQREAIAEDALLRVGIGWQSLDQGGRPIDTGGAPIDAEDRESHSEVAVPPARRPAVAAAIPARILLSRTATPLGAEQADALARGFQLSPSEARLACRLASGDSLTEAAAALGLTVETARTYSKSLYAKSGAHGQGPLVAWVLASAAVLA